MGGPSIQSIMTKSPLVVKGSDSIDTASEVMEKNQIHHLPVVEGSKVIGIVSDRDLRLIAAQYGKIGPRATIHLKDLVLQPAYQVQPQTSLSEVAKTMAESHFTAAVVVEGESVQGIFTITDACRWINLQLGN